MDESAVKTQMWRCPLCDADSHKAFMDIRLDPAQAGYLGVDVFHLVRCGGCGLLYLNPRPSDELLRFYYSHSEQSRKFMEDVMIGEKNIKTKYWDNALDRLERLLGRPGRLLDIGCGAGGLVRTALNRGWDAMGVDSSELLAAAAVKLCPGRIRCAPFRADDYDPDSFDVVTLFDVLEHVTDIHGVISDAARLLRPGGILTATVPDARSPFFRLYRRRWRMVITVGHITYFDRPAVERLLDGHGLRPILWKRPEFDSPRPFAAAAETAKFLARAAIAFTALPVLRAVPPLRPTGDAVARRVNSFPSIADSIRVYSVKSGG
jgi:2-polyprenyl-3-methyl-5-hydroxy-6-metoxy-1,4-benzoquinol methylase